MPSYEQNKNSKLWSVRFRYQDAYGNTHQKRLSGYKTKKLAQKGYEEYCIEMADKKNKKLEINSELLLSRGMTFNELIDKYLEFHKSRVKYSSYYTNAGKINTHIRPYFANMHIDDIKPITILDWQNTISEFSYKYRVGLMGLLSAIYRYGEKYHDITNIMTKVDRPRNTEKKKEMLLWTLEEFEQFISKVDDPTYNLYFTMLYILGCRKGELEALTWNDVDFNSKTVSINKSVTTKTALDSAYEVTSPKNSSSNRKIQIPDFLCQKLKLYKKDIDNYSPENFILGNTRPLPPTTTLNFFNKTCEMAGVKKIRIHDFRHSCASLLISKGVSIVAVSKRLGHANIEQTLNTYSHMMPDDEKMMLSVFNEIGTQLGTKN